MRKSVTVLASSIIVLCAQIAVAQPLTPQPQGPSVAHPVLPKGVDLRPQINQKGLTVLDQDGRPTCSIFATAFLIEYMQPDRPPGWRASIEYLNWAANTATKVIDDGSYFEDVADGYAKFGEIDEAKLPYAVAFDANLNVTQQMQAEGKANRRLMPFMIRPNDGTWGLSGKVMKDIFASLDAGVPVAAGFRLNAEITTATFGSVTAWAVLPPNGKDPAAHSMPLVGYQQWPGSADGGYFIIRNSVGPMAGDHGYVYATYKFVQANVADVIVFRLPPPRIQVYRTLERLPAFRKPRPYPTRVYASVNMLRQLSSMTRRTAPH